MKKSEDLDADVIVATLLCPYCDSELGNAATICQRCGNQSAPSTGNPFQSPASQDIHRTTGSANKLVSVLLTVGLIGLLVVVGLETPGVAILLALFTIPPWIRTALVMSRRSRTGLDTSAAASATMYLGSAFVTWLILFIALVSCFLTFCFACLGALTISNDEQVVFKLAGVAAFAVFLAITLAFSPWIRSRWVKDTSKK